MGVVCSMADLQAVAVDDVGSEPRLTESKSAAEKDRPEGEGHPTKRGARLRRGEDREQQSAEQRILHVRSFRVVRPYSPSAFAINTATCPRVTGLSGQ